MRGALVCGAVLAMVTSWSVAAEAMNGYRWKKRPLVVFAGSATDPSLARQRAVVAANRAAFAERDMVIVYVVGDDVSSDLGGGPVLSASAMRARYDVGGAAFRAVLVGKDGGVKLTSSKPLGDGVLFSTIDVMPMRRDEMRKR